MQMNAFTFEQMQRSLVSMMQEMTLVKNVLAAHNMHVPETNQAIGRPALET